MLTGKGALVGGNEVEEFIDSGIYEEYHGKTLDSYVGNVPVEVLNHVKAVIDSIGPVSKRGIGLFFFGPNGTGKTGLMAEVLKAAIRAGYSARMASLGGIIQKLSDGWYSSDAREEFLKYVKQVDFLGIDEVGKEYRGKSELVVTAFDLVLKYREQRMLPTFMTSNRYPKDLVGDYSESIMSVLKSQMIPIELCGRDWREVIAKGNLEFIRGLM